MSQADDPHHLFDLFTVAVESAESSALRANLAAADATYRIARAFLAEYRRPVTPEETPRVREWWPALVLTVSLALAFWVGWVE